MTEFNTEAQKIKVYFIHFCIFFDKSRKGCKICYSFFYKKCKGRIFLPSEYYFHPIDLHRYFVK
ncbi:MAG: hypothetical protein BWK80_03610 [Desulfobacteraceae bacterium IS3]|nr:MAG: hypothetical protein BWK80_03610 [Desulfobacteraceae bacterium IS3]